MLIRKESSIFKFTLGLFDEGDLPRKNINGVRHYLLPDGQLVPSVTSVLSFEEKPELVAWRERLGEEQARIEMHAASSRGNVIHTLLEEMLRGCEQTEISMVSPCDRLMFQSISSVVKANIGSIYGIEQKLYSTTLGVAGTADLIADWNGMPSIIDFKTSKKAKREDWVLDYFLQESMYAVMVAERTNGKLITPQIVTLIVNGDDYETQIFVKRAREYQPIVIERLTRYFQAQALT